MYDVKEFNKISYKYKKIIICICILIMMCVINLYNVFPINCMNLILGFVVAVLINYNIIKETLYYLCRYFKTIVKQN